MSNTAPHASIRHSISEEPLATQIYALEVEAAMLCVDYRDVTAQMRLGPMRLSLHIPGYGE
jgi:hypothetical protein